MNLMQNGCQNSVWTCRPVRSFTAWIYPPGALEYVTTFRFKIIIFDELKKPSMDKDLLESLRRSLGLVYFDENATWLWHLNHEKRVTWVEKYSLWTRDIAYIYIYIYREREAVVTRKIRLSYMHIWHILYIKRRKRCANVRQSCRETFEAEFDLK